MTFASLRRRLQRLEQSILRGKNGQPSVRWDFLFMSPAQAAAQGSDWVDLAPEAKAELEELLASPVEDSIARALQEEIARLDMLVKDVTPADDSEGEAG